MTDRKMLAAKVESLLREEAYTGAFWGVRVETTGGEVVVDHHGAAPFIPASTVKLFTTLAAIDLLGPDFRWETPLLGHGVVEGDTLHGDLVIRGSGDPLIAPWDEEEQRHRLEVLSEWAAALRGRGIRRIVGRILLDHGNFGEPYFHPAWELGLTSDSDAAGTSGLALAENAFRYTITPGFLAGHAANVQVEPIEAARLVTGDLNTVEPGGQSARFLRVRSQLDDTIHFQGAIAEGAPPIVNRAAVPFRDAIASAVIAGAFHQAGIEIHEDPMEAPHEEDAPTPLHVHQSPPLREAVLQCNKWSNNFIAEQLLRTLGAHEAGAGDWEGGTAAVGRWMRETGLPGADECALVDGSGLARRNLLQPRQVCAVLRHGSGGDPRHEAFLSSLPATEGINPLTRRFPMLEGRGVVAKTGSLDHVRALSGYAHRPGGEPLLFSVIVNHDLSSGESMDHRAGRIVAALLA